MALRLHSGFTGGMSGGFTGFTGGIFSLQLQMQTVFTLFCKASGPAQRTPRSSGAAQEQPALPSLHRWGQSAGSHCWSREEAKLRHLIHSIRAGESRNPECADFRQTNTDSKALSFGFHSCSDTANGHGAVSPGNHRCCSPPQRQTRCPLCAAHPALLRGSCWELGEPSREDAGAPPAPVTALTCTERRRE